MPRANRVYLPGHAWHITHRCHKQEFLLKFERDRQRWLHWLFQAKKRYGLCVLNYIVTSNHIHLLVLDTQPDCLSRSMQLIAGRTAQEYNQRKHRKGAFWEDRYFATIVEMDAHLAKCLTYIDMNMIRAGVVSHPSQWKASGYNEIQHPALRYRIIDRLMLKRLLGINTEESLKERHNEWVLTVLQNDDWQRQSLWSQSLAVGSDAFVDEVRKQLAIRLDDNKGSDQAGDNEIKEACTSYKVDLPIEMRLLTDKNDGSVNII